MRLAVFTICANRHVPQADVLFETVARFLPEADRVLILADTPHPGLSYPAGCEVVTADALGIADFRQFAFRYDAMEFEAALKPFAFLHLLQRHGITHALYVASDTELHSSLPPVTDALDTDASFVLIPQLLSPAAPETDIAVMREGVFDLGFLGVSRTEEALALLRWWARWLLRHCFDDRPIGMFIDQKFMDLLPGFARTARILRDPGLTLGHRTLQQRRFVPHAPGGPQVDGRPLGFFRHGGFGDGESGDGESGMADSGLGRCRRRHATSWRPMTGGWNRPGAASSPTPPPMRGSPRACRSPPSRAGCFATIARPGPATRSRISRPGRICPPARCSGASAAPCPA